MVRKLKEFKDINSLINAVSNRIDELENEEVMDEGLLTETEDEGSMNSFIRAVSKRINELELNDFTEDLETNKTFEFDGYEFDPNSPWTEIWDAVISPIIDSQFNHVGIGGYTQQEAEDDIDAKINIFCEEFLDYPNVVRACNKFFDENDI